MDKHTIRNKVDGSVDVSASVNTYAAALSKWVSENEIPSEDIKNALDSVFATVPVGSTIPKAALIAYATTALNPSPGKMTAFQSRIEAFLRGSPDYFSVMGKGGGIRKVTPEAEATGT